MKKQIFRAIIKVALAVLMASLVLIVAVLHKHFLERVTHELGQSTAYIAHGVENEGLDYLTEGLPQEDRITWVAPDGTVLFDNRQEASTMANHAAREEIAEALQFGEGMAVRHSDTQAQQTIYYAMRLPDGSVVRLAAAQQSVWALVLQALQPVVLVMLLALAMALYLAGQLSRQLVAPINAIDLRDPDDTAYEELAPLVSRLRSQNRQIRRQMDDLRRRQEEFNAITAHMSEGLLVLDKEARVLSHNSAARALLQIRMPVEGERVQVLSREAGLHRCVEEALAGRHCEELLEGSRRVLASPVTQDGRLTGAVLMVLDVTEKEQREALRREFTANVSHELKTPLTGILGTAELLQSGLVKPQDISHFAGNIHREARRLIDLVNDIIKISRLDEGGFADAWERVDLHAVAEQVRQQLALAAEQKRVTVEVRGGSAWVMGVPRIIEEIVYNLCDNAIAYNVTGGRVDLTVVNSADGARLIVADSGTGIPPEAQERVFERFYRVDQSHSGSGTGLGLSIVKHGAAYLGAQVSLESKVGKGSVFTLIFPKQEG